MKELPEKYCIYGCLIGTIITSIGAKWIAMSIYNQKIGINMSKFTFEYVKYFCGTGIAVLSVLFVSRFFPQNEWPWMDVLLRGGAFLAFYAPVLVLLNHRTIKSLINKKRGLKNR